MKINFFMKIFVITLVVIISSVNRTYCYEKDNFDFYMSNLNCENSEKPIDIPTYVENDNSVVHPSVLYFENPWNGYKYWMAFTPYTNTDPKYENPSIAASNDGINWSIPYGVSNPIAKQPENGFNSDVHIFMDKNNEKMYCIWREVTADNKILIMSSVDGISWSQEKTIIECEKNDCASPCVIYDNGKYIMFGVDLFQSRTDGIQMYESDDPEGEWTYVKDIKIPGISSDKQLWHFELRKYYDEYFMVYTVAPLGYYGGCGQLYLAKSKDLVNWEITDKPIIQPGTWDNAFYKSSFIIREKDGQTFLDLWYGTTDYEDEQNSRWDVGFTSTQLSVDNRENDNTILAYDNFNRSNNESSLGITDTGQEWNNLLGQLGIKDKHLYNPSKNDYTNAIAVIDVLLNDYDVSIKFDNLSEEQWIVVRVKDAYNFIRAGYAYDSLVIQNVTNGIAEDIYYEDYLLNNGDTVGLLCSGNNIKLKVNGEIKASIYNDYNKEYTLVGIQTPQIDTRVDDFIVKGNSLVWDSFNRPDNEYTLGITNNGLTWNNILGTLGIKDKQLYNSSEEDYTNAISVIDVSTNNYGVSAKFSSLSEEQWIIVRAKDAYNFIRVGYAYNSLVIQKVVDGIAEDIYSENYLLKNNDRIKILCIDNVLKLLVNNKEVMETTESYNEECTMVGLQTSQITSKIDDFLVEG